MHLPSTINFVIGLNDFIKWTLVHSQPSDYVMTQFFTEHALLFFCDDLTCY